VRDYALETLADADGVLVIDETGFLKQGKSSCGVGRQYTGSAGGGSQGSIHEVDGIAAGGN
jgi:SRSO17 transposase